MRKLLTILLISVLCCSLVSCGGAPSENGIAFTARGFGCLRGIKYDGLLFFDSREGLDSYYEEHLLQLQEELDAYYEDFLTQYEDEFATFFQKYDDAYFEKQVLVGVLNSTGPNVDRSVQSLKFRDGKYILTIKSIINLDEDFVTELYPPYYFFIEPEAGHKITASNFEVEWITETVE